jgi:hypothetical protein
LHGYRQRREVFPGPHAPIIEPAQFDAVQTNWSLARLMALAIRCQDLIRRGAVSNYTDLAHLGHVSRQRMAQIMALNNLAPDIQERLLFLTREEARGVREKPVLRAAALPSWGAQRAAGNW